MNYIEVCEMRLDDFEEVVALWEGNAEGGFPCGGDAKAFAEFLAKTRGLNLIAREGEVVVGIAFCMKRDVGGGVCMAMVDSTKDREKIAQILIDKSIRKFTFAVGKCQIKIINEGLDHKFWHASQWHFDPAMDNRVVADEGIEVEVEAWDGVGVAQEQASSVEAA